MDIDWLNRTFTHMLFTVWRTELLWLYVLYNEMGTAIPKVLCEVGIMR